MSKRRMFSQSIVESDAFLDMPLSSQGLYFHLCMHADDYGFISPRRIMRMIGANDDDLKLLIMKRFLLSFDGGIAVIKHWHINNTIRKDRSNPTTYTKEFKLLINNEIGAYTERRKIISTIETVENATTILASATDTADKVATNGQPHDNRLATQIRLDKNRIDKIRLEKTNKPPTPTALASKSALDKIDPKIIDAIFENWEQTVGYPISGIANRKACIALVREIGEAKVNQLILGVYKSHQDQYAPRISDFVSLKRKINDLILWGRKKGMSNAAAQF